MHRRLDMKHFYSYPDFILIICVHVNTASVSDECLVWDSGPAASRQHSLKSFTTFISPPTPITAASLLCGTWFWQF